MKLGIGKTYYGVLIDNGSGTFQFYRGWDHIFTDRSKADTLLSEAKRKFPAAKLTSADEAEARRFGWLSDQESA